MAFTEGTPVQLSALGYNPRQRKLDTDKTLSVYTDGSGCRGRIIDVSGGSISAGAEQTIWDTEFLGELDVWVISPTLAVLFGKDAGSGDMEIRTLTISGTTITENTAAVVEAGTGNFIDGRMAMISATVGMVTYHDTSTNRMRLCRFTISGTTVTPGTPQDHSAVDLEPRGLCQISASHVLLTYFTTSDSSVYVQVYDISSTISGGTASQIPNAVMTTSGWYPSIKIDTGKVFVFFKDSFPSPDRVQAWIVTTSGTTISAIGSPYDVTSGDLGGTPVAASHGCDVIDTSTVVVTYSVSASPRDLYAETLNITGTTITSNSDAGKLTYVCATSGLGENCCVSFVDSGQYIALMKDQGTGDIFVSLLDNSIAQLRYLGLASDETNIYITYNQGGVLKFDYYDLATLTSQGGTTFGNATYAEIDSNTYGIYPVRVPNAQNKLYLRGRDGNDLQTQYNDLNGTLGWVDVGQGTATWGTAKFAAALMIDPLWPNDVVVAFDDNDIYQTTQGTTNWVKMGDAPTNLGAGMRVTLSNNELLLGGTAPGTIHYTPNWGVSFGVASDASLGTVNWIEESR